ncbi:MAG: helix-turn-helix transcriptional regulator [Mogibacterium sp.]|nr:helix-turn-helix transcriptional regulator [Mogibacterium sp.]
MKTRIKEIRKEKGISQKELAEKLHIAPSALSQIERPENNTQLSTLEKIAAALNCSVFELIDKDSFESASSSEKAALSNMAIDRANEKISRASDICAIAGYSWILPDEEDGFIHLVDKKTNIEYAVTDESFTAAVDGSGEFIDFNFEKLMRSAKIVNNGK